MIKRTTDSGKSQIIYTVGNGPIGFTVFIYNGGELKAVFADTTILEIAAHHIRGNHFHLTSAKEKEYQPDEMFMHYSKMDKDNQNAVVWEMKWNKGVISNLIIKIHMKHTNEPLD